MIRFIALVVLMVVLSGCFGSVKTTGEISGINSSTFAEPAPFGMVLVKRGSFTMGTDEADSLWGLSNQAKDISLESFWMDDTEVTNAQYKRFLYYVRDSIIRERLYDPAYGGNEMYKITEDREGNPIGPFLDWSQPIPTARRATEEELAAIESVYYIDPIDGTKKLDPKQMNFKYEWYDYTSAALRRNQLDPTRRSRNTDITPDLNEVIMISKDTAYVTDEGEIVNETITRPLSSPFDFLHTRIVNIYPDETCWVNDFTNAYNEPYMKMYFSHPGYNDYPVVGVSWEQAMGYCAWRTETFRKSLGGLNVIFEPFRLPTESEWEFAARNGKSLSKFPWGEDVVASEKGCFYGNFKPGKGDYTRDGNLITSKVASYPPNEFGLYDMAGNVAEWTSTAYTEAGLVNIGDFNPELRYNAAQEDPYRLKRKVVRGGSWKDITNFIRSDIRGYEYQNEQRSYIGFRCVRTQVGFVKGKSPRK